MAMQSRYLVKTCEMQLARDCAERLFQCWPHMSEADPETYLQRMTEVFMRYSPDAVRKTCNEASERFKKRPSIAHMLELLNKRPEADERHNDVIDRYTNYKPPPPPEIVAKDLQTVKERTDFLNETLARHGFGPVGSVLKRM